ncbi:hypothetical protein [Streptomyces microflavus]|uniref:hypothetical protein n=1 Tax=Streptomyces microflavus TaxID=1919 RepID=UPI003B2218F9
MPVLRDYLAGVLAAGHLEAASTVRKLPAAMFPDWLADMVQAVWDAALAVGFQAGGCRSARRGPRKP